jgi:hypothetical protein
LVEVKGKPGAGITLGSGLPLTALAANPVDDCPGEIPETPRGEGFDTVDGFRDRAEMQRQFDLHLDYNLRLRGNRNTLLADFFNLFNTQQVEEFDNWTEIHFQVPNPDFGQRLVFQTPRQVRLGSACLSAVSMAPMQVGGKSCCPRLVE